MTPPIRCEKHGKQRTTLVCPHVKEAVFARSRELLEYKKLSQDFLPDGPSLHLTYLLCAACIQDHKIDPGEMVPFPEDDPAAAKFADVHPVCRECFREYEEAHVTASRSAI